MDSKFFVDDIFSKSLDYKVNLSKSLGLFFLLVSANFIGNILGCKIQTIFNSNIVLKHLLGFISLLFFITILTNSEYKDKNNKIIKRKFHESIKDSFYVYFFFLLLSKTHYEITLFVYLCIFTIYSLSLIRNDYYKDNLSMQQKINYANYMLFYIIILTTVLGFIIYNLDKYNEYGRHGPCFLNKKSKKCFSYFKFLFGKTSCKEN